MSRGGAVRDGIEIVRCPERLAALEPAWTRLWQRQGDGGSVFQSHCWLSAWWGSTSASRRPQLHVGLLWRNGELAAAMPLAVTQRKGVWMLEWAAKEHSDYCDALVAPGDATALQELWLGVRAAGGFDLAYLSHLAPGSQALALGEAASLRLHHRQEVNLRVRGPWATGAAWFDALPKKPRQNYRRGWKTLAETGAASFRLVGEGEDVSPILDRLVALKRDWLERTGQTSSLLDGGAGSLRAFVDVLRRRGALRLFVIELDGTVVAGTVNFVEGGRMAAFFAAYDPAQERASVGMLLMTDYVRWAFDNGAAEIDFLCGAEEYKLRFADSRQELVSLIGGRTFLGRAAVAIDRRLAARREEGSRDLLRSRSGTARPVLQASRS